jgi:hypothetical protein
LKYFSSGARGNAAIDGPRDKMVRCLDKSPVMRR